MAHCFAIGALLGRPGAPEIVDHAMQFLWTRHRDTERGGYFWSVDDHGPVDASKQGYGHAFVLLAAASAKAISHPLAETMLADAAEILESRFWKTGSAIAEVRRGLERGAGLSRAEFEHAPHRGADGGVRGDRGRAVPQAGRADRQTG